VLRGPLHLVHHALAATRTRDEAFALVADRCGRVAFDKALTELLRLGLCLEIEGRCLSLALREPLKPFVLDRDWDFNIFVRSLIAAGRPLFAAMADKPART
jgi:hypothetical protein